MILKSIKLVLVSLFVAFSGCNLTKSPTQEKVIISETSGPEESNIQQVISENSVKTSLEFLASDELRGRETGTQGINKAARFIEGEFKKAGIKPYFETYRDSFEVSGKTGFNVVGVIEGTDLKLRNEYVILGAHYDHIGVGKIIGGDSIANGANDNAAGTVAVLELAKHFAGKKENKRSILVILFSAEEMGLQGSKHNASRLKAKGLDLYAMLNFEMVGIPMTGKDYQAYLTGFENSNMAEKFNEYSGAKILGFLPQAKQFNLFQRSDNYPFFQEFGVPAQTISTFDFTNYDYYHHVSDEADKMDYAHMANLISNVIPGIRNMANSAGKEIKMN